ncbi:MAG: hypothetical protein H6622_03935 [Halobacteriovoraceae bacterium]|nr:hypothetical protein [Halobacteriovoraceae bacterium]
MSNLYLSLFIIFSIFLGQAHAFNPIEFFNNNKIVKKIKKGLEKDAKLSDMILANKQRNFYRQNFLTKIEDEYSELINISESYTVADNFRNLFSSDILTMREYKDLEKAIKSLKIDEFESERFFSAISKFETAYFDRKKEILNVGHYRVLEKVITGKINKQVVEVFRRNIQLSQEASINDFIRLYVNIRYIFKTSLDKNIGIDVISKDALGLSQDLLDYKLKQLGSLDRGITSGGIKFNVSYLDTLIGLENFRYRNDGWEYVNNGNVKELFFKNFSNDGAPIISMDLYSAHTEMLSTIQALHEVYPEIKNELVHSDLVELIGKDFINRFVRGFISYNKIINEQEHILKNPSLLTAIVQEFFNIFKATYRLLRYGTKAVGMQEISYGVYNGKSFQNALTETMKIQNNELREELIESFMATVEKNNLYYLLDEANLSEILKADEYFYSRYIISI